MKRLLAFSPLIVLAALAVMFAGWSLNRDPQFRPDAAVGRTLPALTLDRLEAGATPTSLAELADGRPMVVNLFASWCAPCRIEHPHLMAMRERGVRVVGVAYKDAPEATAAFLTELGDPFETVLVDDEGRLGLELGVSGVPETFVVGADGRIGAKLSGPIVDAGEAERLIQALR